MTKHQMARAVALSLGASLLVAPVIVGLFTRTSLGSIAVGALTASVFFAVSGTMAVVTWDQTSLKKPLLTSYAAKVLLLLVAGFFLAGTELDRNAFAVGAVASAISYLLAQVVVLSRTGSDQKR